MNNDLSVRSLLLDKTTGKFIKAVDERDLSDFLPLLAKSSREDNKVQVFDFTPLIQYFHNDLENKLKQREHKDLTIKRGTVFNTWMRLSTITNENLLCQLSSQIMKDSEEVLNWIYTRLPEIKSDIYTAKEEPRACKNAKTEAVYRFSDDVEVFFEVLLCNIHTTAKVDIDSLKSDFIIMKHCNSIRGIILELLQSEANYRNGSFSWYSVIYNICMENIGINSDALVNLIDSTKNSQDIKNIIISEASWSDEWDGNCEYRKYTLRFPKADSNKIERIKVLSKLLESINSILSLLNKLKEADIYFNQSEEAKSEFESAFQALLPSRNIIG